MRALECIPAELAREGVTLSLDDAAEMLTVTMPRRLPKALHERIVWAAHGLAGDEGVGIRFQ